jgi:hypothetical protein
MPISGQPGRLEKTQERNLSQMREREPNKSPQRVPVFGSCEKPLSPEDLAGARGRLSGLRDVVLRKTFNYLYDNDVLPTVDYLEYCLLVFDILKSSLGPEFVEQIKSELDSRIVQSYISDAVKVFDTLATDEFKTSIKGLVLFVALEIGFGIDRAVLAFDTEDDLWEEFATTKKDFTFDELLEDSFVRKTFPFLDYTRGLYYVFFRYNGFDARSKSKGGKVCLENIEVAQRGRPLDSFVEDNPLVALASDANKGRPSLAAREKEPDRLESSRLETLSN